MSTTPCFRYTNADGVKKFQGGPGLKGTQMYTPEFGRALAAWWMAHGPVSAGTDIGLCAMAITTVQNLI